MSRSAPRWLITVSVLTGTIMAVLDASIVNVALPDMSGSLGASTTEITWVIAGYMLANVVIMPIIAGYPSETPPATGRRSPEILSWMKPPVHA